MTKIDVSPVETSTDLQAFIRLTKSIYADDKNFVAPLEFELKARLNSSKNPSLKKSDHQLWIAWKDGQPVGRISAMLNQDHLNLHNDQTGHFGFFESINDKEVSSALIKTARDWLGARQMKKIAGPFNFSVNEECGLLIDGFDTRPYIMMPHGKPYYREHLEHLNFEKVIDMHALEWLPRRNFIPEKRLKFVEKTLNKPEVTIRNLKASELLDDLRIILDIYNDAWSDNFGFIQFGEDHARHMANELRPIMQEHNAVLCYYKGEPAAFGLVLPNINHAIQDFDGKLLPFNWAKLLWRLKVTGIPQSRMPLMGVRKHLQKRPVGAGFAYKIIEMVNSSNMDHGVNHSELSWILENNQSMLTMLQDMGAKIYKTYRIYSQDL